MSNTNKISYSNALENIVYNEFISRGYKVYIGKLYQKEVDFVIMKGTNLVYVTYLMAEEETMEREFKVLEEIKDNYPKFVISLDALDMSRNGIKHINLINDFLLFEDFNF